MDIAFEVNEPEVVAPRRSGIINLSREQYNAQHARHILRQAAPEEDKNEGGNNMN